MNITKNPRGFLLIELSCALIILGFLGMMHAFVHARILYNARTMQLGVQNLFAARSEYEERKAFGIQKGVR